MFDETDILEPNSIGTAFRFFWSALPIRKPITLTDLAWLAVDAIWH